MLRRSRYFLPSPTDNFRVFTSLRRIIHAKNKSFRFFATGKEVMDLQAPCTLVFSGKTSAEKEAATSLKIMNKLKLPDSTEVKAYLDSEKENLPSSEHFRTHLYYNALSTYQFGRFLIWSPRLASTHDVISHNFGELPIGTACVADIQFKGRGRSKNVWESPNGCLMFSFSLQMEDGRAVPLVQYVVCLAITEAIKDLCDQKRLPYLGVRIKWPNDLYVNGLKVGGILCTSTYRSKKFNVSAGIGLNIDNEQPSICLNQVLRESFAVDQKLTREEVLASFFNKFEKLYDIFINQGFQTLEQLYYQTWLHSGQRVIVQEENEGEVVENAVTIQGLTSSGYLLAIGDDNQMCELHPDGKSFDFLKGLIKRKLN